MGLLLLYVCTCGRIKHTYKHILRSDSGLVKHHQLSTRANTPVVSLEKRGSLFQT